MGIKYPHKYASEPSALRGIFDRLIKLLDERVSRRRRKAAIDAVFDAKNPTVQGKDLLIYIMARLHPRHGAGGPGLQAGTLPPRLA